MKSGFKGLFLASAVGLSVALISGCNTEEAPPESVPPAPAVDVPAPGDTPKAPEVKDAAPVDNATAPAVVEPAAAEPKKAD